MLSRRGGQCGPQPGSDDREHVVGLHRLDVIETVEEAHCPAGALQLFAAGLQRTCHVDADIAPSVVVGDLVLGAGEAWRREVMAWTEDLVELYVRHPWALQVSYGRPGLGPHEQRVLESVVGILRGTGLEPGLLRRVVGMLVHVVRGTALTIAGAREAIETTGMAEGEWWQGVATALSRVVPDFEDRFPNTMWLLSPGRDEDTAGDGSTDYVDRHAREDLRVGIGVILDGLAAATGSG